jgi:drug/metabolite transporter (DMT)-like permease
VTALAYAGCALVWGTTWFAIRVCMGPGGYPPFAGAAIRFVIAVAVLAALVAVGLAGRGPTDRRQLTWIGVAGVMCGLGYGLVYAGETRISGGLAAVIFGLLPLMTGVATFLAGTERPPARFFAGSLVALGGIAIIYADRMTASANQALGVTLVFASVLVCAIYTIILKRHASNTDPLATNLPFLSAAALSLLLFAASYERQLPPWPPAVRPTVALLYLAVFGSVITFALYFYLLRRMSVTAASTLVFVEPVLALLIDAGFEREIRLGARSYAGAAVTLLGVAISLLLRPGCPRTRRTRAAVATKTDANPA